MSHLLDQLYKTKLRFAGLLTAVVGVGFLFFSNAVASTPTFSWLVGWPLNELGTTLLSAGVIAVIFEYYARKEADERATEHFRTAIRQEAPAIRDAVLDSFAFNAEALKDIASDDTLDRIAANAIGLRVGDQRLGHQAYADLRDQVIRSPERWRDVDVSVSLTPWPGGPATGNGSMFVATVRWEYKVKPASRTMRFASVSDLAEYRDLLHDPTVASAWYVGRNAGLDAADPEAFTLLQFSVNGRDQRIRRTARNGSQQATVTLDAKAVDHEVTLSYTYRVLVQRHGHLLYLDAPRPAKGVRVQLDYTTAGIRRVNVLDYFASPETARVEQSPAAAPARTVDVSFDGQVFPRAGVAFVWVLEEELS
ncbi:hypothetical protein [Amycolatopsis alkalitolerans]|uniref:Uncharacterized protein n=1 Tax=Amycolatopsis alkalitolerans TaxID=2547244 RepID=A0A5C4LXX6_9PSEU|nr:hypothetical protein [Amycolatopsis alkalitolerans]TNC23730.1 hypothetical protein FG385_20415 [Amycolatopsis alkalitolerans]